MAAGFVMSDIPGRVSWRAVLAMVRHSEPRSALQRTIDPSGWDTQTELAAQQADALAWLVWAKTPDGQKNRKQPKPFPRPGDDARQRSNDSQLQKEAGVVGDLMLGNGGTIGTASMTLDETRKWLGW